MMDDGWRALSRPLGDGWERATLSRQPNSSATDPAHPGSEPPRLYANRLSSSEASNWHAEWRAGDVAEPDIVAELNGGRIATVLAADTDLELLLGGAVVLKVLAQASNVQRDKALEADVDVGGTAPRGAAALSPRP